MRKTYSGAAAATTTTGFSAAASSIPIAVGAGASYPSGAVGPFVVVVGPETPNEEQILCSGKTGDSLNVSVNGRNYHLGGAATGVAHASGEAVRHVLDADSIDEANAHVNDDALDSHSQYLLTTGTRAPTGITALAGVPGTAVVGDVAAKGSGPTLAANDHKHAIPRGTPVGLGSAAAAGAAGTFADSAHIHPDLHMSCRVVAAGDSCANGGYTVISWDSADWDCTEDLWTSGTDVTLKKVGLWIVSGWINLPSSVTYTSAFAEVRQNGAPGVVGLNGNGAHSTSTNNVIGFEAQVLTTDTDDVLTLAVFQASGGARALAQAKMTATWLGYLS